MEEFFGENTFQVEPTVTDFEGLVSETDPLKLELKDSDIVDVVDTLIKDSRKFFINKGLYERRAKNEEYYLGKQTARLEEENQLKKYSARYQDNIIFESAGTLKAVAVSRVPDLLVIPSDESEESEKVSKELTEVINNRLRKRENREVLGKAFKHRPIYFTGIIKARWDSERGKLGDYVFENIHPDNIDVDHTATSNNPDDMLWIAHHYDLTIKEILMRWPSKKNALFDELKWEKDQTVSEKKMASKLRISEVWFTWYKKEGEEWVRLEGVVWKYKRLVLDKVKNPYWDWEGDTILFKYDVETGKKVKAEETDLRNAFLFGDTGLGLDQQEIFYNYFSNPKKPFIFMGYEQLGKQPYDETSRIEQGIYLQDNINIRGRQITDMANSAKGKSVFSTESGLNAADVEEIDMGNPDQDILVDGELNKVYSFIPGVSPNAALFQDQIQNRERLFSKLGTNAALRGVREGPDPATKTQLFKESDFTRIDDEVEDTINHAAEQMAGWAMQFIRLFYTEDHLERITGNDSSVTFQSINRDLVEDGMLVEVSASSVDKLRRKREAFELAGINMIDPVQFYKDIEASDPEGRAEKLILFQTQPALYFQKFVEGRETTEEQVGALGQMPTTTPQSPEVSAVERATSEPTGGMV